MKNLSKKGRIAQRKKGSSEQLFKGSYPHIDRPTGGHPTSELKGQTGNLKVLFVD